MCPKVEIQTDVAGSWSDPKTILDVPDVPGVTSMTGTYATPYGEIVLEVDTNNGQKVVTLTGEIFKGGERDLGYGNPTHGPEKRTIVLSKKKGVGSQKIDNYTRVIVSPGSEIS